MDKNLEFALKTIIETKALNQGFRDSLKQEFMSVKYIYCHEYFNQEKKHNYEINQKPGQLTS